MQLQRQNTPRPPNLPFECLQFNLILTKMPVEMSGFPHESDSSLEGINGIQQRTNNYIPKVYETYI